MEVASFSGLSLPLIYELVWDYTLEVSKVVNQQLAASVRHLWGNPQLAISLCVRRGGLYVSCIWTALWICGLLENPCWSNAFMWGTAQSAL